MGSKGTIKDAIDKTADATALVETAVIVGDLRENYWTPILSRLHECVGLLEQVQSDQTKTDTAPPVPNVEPHNQGQKRIGSPAAIAIAQRHFPAGLADMHARAGLQPPEKAKVKHIGSCHECGARSTGECHTGRWAVIGKQFNPPRICCTYTHLVEYLQAKADG